MMRPIRPHLRIAAALSNDHLLVMSALRRLTPGSNAPRLFTMFSFGT
jgi:hypothetical protein